MMSRQVLDETERVRRLWDRAAPRYDKSMGFFERVLFQGGREWVCSKAEGDVLEIAVDLLPSNVVTSGRLFL